MTDRGLAPFFERCAGSITGLPADGYVTGLRGGDSDIGHIRINVPAELVDRTVLAGAHLSLWLRAGDGKLILDGSGLGDEALETALETGPIGSQTLLSLIEACLAPEHLAAEDDPVGDLSSLKSQLMTALAKVDDALAKLPQG